MPTGIKLRIDPPGKFAGKSEEHYEEFSKQLRNYMSIQDMRFGEFMLWAQRETMGITEEMIDAHDDIDDDNHTTRKLSTLLYYVLGSLTEGTAYVLVDQVENNNGWEALRRLELRYSRTKMQ